MLRQLSEIKASTKLLKQPPRNVRKSLEDIIQTVCELIKNSLHNRDFEVAELS